MTSDKNRHLDDVDPFIGSEAVDLPRPEGVAATWFYLKAQIGNTHPGACLPFSYVSACPYSGGYPTGYGRYDINTHGTPAKRYTEKCAFGITHVHHSGTGYIQHFYNYLLTIPFIGSAPAVPSMDLTKSLPSPLKNECAIPGSYSARFGRIEVGFELAVFPGGASHVYRFDGQTVGTKDDLPRGVIVDLTNCGLAPSRAAQRAERVSALVQEDGSCIGTAILDGVPWYFALVCQGAANLQPELWKSDETVAAEDEGGVAPGWVPAVKLDGATRLSMDAESCGMGRGGVIFTATGTDELFLTVGLSLDSERAALSSALEAKNRGFSVVRSTGKKLWEEHLSRIHVEGGNEKQRRIFYSALYHSMIKPVAADRSSWLWKNGPQLYTDFATMWDQYKTHIPLVFTLFPDRIGPIVNSLLETHRSIGYFPPGMLFANDFERFFGQSRALCHGTLWDAYLHSEAAQRGPGGVGGTSPVLPNWNDILSAMVASLKRDAGNVRPGAEAQGFSHLLDIGYGAYCTLRLAESLGDERAAGEAKDLIHRWKDAFDPTTGMMKEGEYYEAGNVSYSFRLLHDMEGRIDLCGGVDEFLKRLDSYFGFEAKPVDQLGGPPWDNKRAAGMALGRFDGVNNEVAIETPFAYMYAGRPDSTVEIIRAVMKYHYNDTPGGLPGNDDSGALSSWYVWNATGLYPVPGQGIFFIGSPIFDAVTLTMGSRKLEIRVDRESQQAIYLKQAAFNGNILKGSFLSYQEVLGGGALEIQLGESRDAFVPEELPPSHRFIDHSLQKENQT